MQEQFFIIIQLLKSIEQLLRDANIGSSDYLPHKDAAKYIHVTPQTLYHLVSQGKITPTKPNGKLSEYKRSSLDNYLSNNKSK